MDLLLIAELLVLGAALGLMLRIAVKPPFRRDYRELPRTWVLAAATIVGVGLVACVWAILRWPALRHVATVATVVGWTLAYIRARPTYGVRRGLPPGSLGIGQSIDAIYDRSFYMDQVRQFGPVFKMSQFGRPVVCVYGLKRARDLLASQGDALIGASLPYNRALGKGALRYMASNTHQEERPLFRQALGTLDLAACEAAVRASCVRQLSALAADSAATSTGVRPRSYFERFLLEALSRTFFGLDAHEVAVDSIGRLLPDIEVGRMGGRAWRAKLEGAMAESTRIMRTIGLDASAGKRQLEPGTALGTLLTLDPDALNDTTRARNLFIAFRLAHGDVAGLLHWIFTQLSRHPEWQQAVRGEDRVVGESAGSQPRDIGSRVVLETLRLEQSEFLYRRVLRPVSVDGYTIPAGWLIRVLVHESHQDPAVFPEPTRFDPDRFLHRSFDKTEYAPFGADVHGCMGARLALFLGRILVEEACHGFVWHISQDGPLERGTRHRHHWRPSSRQHVQLRLRAPVDGQPPAPDLVAH